MGASTKTSLNNTRRLTDGVVWRLAMRAATILPAERKKISPLRPHFGCVPPSVEIWMRPPGPGKGRTYTSCTPDSFETYDSHLPSVDTLGIDSSAAVAMYGRSACGESTGAIQMSRLGIPIRAAR